MDELTKQEIAVLKLMAEGWNNVYIANTLYVERRTIETYINRIFSKLEVKQENRNLRVWATVIYNNHMNRVLVL